MIFYLLLNPGDIIAEADEILTISMAHLIWMPVPKPRIGKKWYPNETPCRRPVSRSGLLILAEEANATRYPDANT